MTSVEFSSESYTWASHRNKGARWCVRGEKHRRNGQQLPPPPQALKELDEENDKKKFTEEKDDGPPPQLSKESDVGSVKRNKRQSAVSGDDGVKKISKALDDRLREEDWD